VSGEALLQLVHLAHPLYYSSYFKSVEDVCEMKQEKSSAKGVTIGTMNDEQM